MQITESLQDHVDSLDWYCAPFGLWKISQDRRANPESLIEILRAQSASTTFQGTEIFMIKVSLNEAPLYLTEEELRGFVEGHSMNQGD